MERGLCGVILSAFGGLRQRKRVIGSDYAEFSAWASGENPLNFGPVTTRIQLPHVQFFEK
jgi:hypothetical protein